MFSLFYNLHLLFWVASSSCCKYSLMLTGTLSVQLCTDIFLRKSFFCFVDFLGWMLGCCFGGSPDLTSCWWEASPDPSKLWLPVPCVLQASKLLTALELHPLPSPAAATSISVWKLHEDSAESLAELVDFISPSAETDRFFLLRQCRS